MFSFFANDNICYHKVKKFGIPSKRSYHGNAQKMDKRPAVVSLACITSDPDFVKDLLEVAFAVIGD